MEVYINFYVWYITAMDHTLDEIPEKYREPVRQRLIELGYTGY